MTFSIVDDALVLDDVRAADGWGADIDEQDADEIEVELADGDDLRAPLPRGPLSTG